MADMKVVQRPDFDFVQSLEQARAIYELNELLALALEKNRLNRDVALGYWEGPWGEEFRKRAEEDDANVLTVTARLRNDADQWGEIWQQAATQTNRCAYAEAVFAYRDKRQAEIDAEKSNLEEAAERARKRHEDNNLLEDIGDGIVTGLDHLGSSIMDAGEAIAEWVAGQDAMGDALEYVQEPGVVPNRPRGISGFQPGTGNFTHYNVGDRTFWGDSPGPVQPILNTDEIHRVPDADPAAEPAETDPAANQPDPIAVEASRSALGADDGLCSINLDALDQYLEGFSIVGGRYTDPALAQAFEATQATQAAAVASVGVHGQTLRQIGLPAVELYLGFLHFNLAGMVAVRQAIGPNQSGTVQVSNAFISAVLRATGLGTPPGLIKVNDPEFAGLPPNSGFADDPVSMATGNFVHTELDLAMPGFSDAIAARRAYNASGSSLGHFGVGWSSLLDMHLLVTETSATARLADGAVVAFPVLEDGTYGPQRGRRLELERVGDSFVLSQGYDSSWTFDADGQLTGGAEGAARWSLERTGDTLTFQDLLGGRTVRYELEADSRLVQSAVTSDGRQATWTYDENLCCVSVERPSGAMTYTVDDQLRIEAITDADGVEFVRNTYDRWGRVETQLNQFSRESAYEYELDGTARIVEADTRELAVQMAHDAKANLLSIVGADGGVMRMEWDAESRMASVTDRKGQRTTYDYVTDAREDLITHTVRPDGLEEHREWDDLGRLVRLVDAGGHTHTFGYDGDSRVAARVTDPLGAVTTFAVDDLDLVTSITDADGVTLTQEWDRDGQLLRVGVANGPQATFTYDAAGELTSVTGPDGQRTEFVNDAGGRVVSSTAANGTRVHTYTAAGRVASSERDGRLEWRIEYGAHGEPTRRFDSAGNPTDFEYDSFGRCVAVLVGDHRFENHFDALGQLLGLSIDGVRITTTAYDSNGNWIRSIDADGISLEREVDAMDRTTLVSRNGQELLAQTNHHDGQPATIRLQGIERQIEVDAAGRPVRVTTERGSLTLTYTPAGRLSSRTTPAGRTAHYAYDANGALASITDADGVASHVTEGGGHAELTRDGEEISLEFDGLGRLTSWSGTQGSGASEWLDGALHVRFGDQNASIVEVDHTGRAVRVVDPAGAATSLTRDRLARIVQMDTVDERIIVEHDVSGAMSGVASSEGVATAVARTAAGRIRQINPTGESIINVAHDRTTGDVAALLGEDNQPLLAFRRDEFSRIAALSTPDSIVEVDHDDSGWAHRIRSSINGISAWEFDADGLVTAINSSAGHRIGIDRSAAGVITAMRSGALLLPNVATTRDGERNAANQIVADDAGRLHRYDDAGRLVESVATNGDRYAFTYTAASMVETEVTPLGERRFFYEGPAWSESTAPKGPITSSTTWSDVGLAKCGPNGDQVGYEWSPLDQLVAIHTVRADGTEHRRSFLYPGLGRVERIDETTIHWDDLLTRKPIGIGDRSFLRSGTHVCEIGAATAWSSGVGDDPYGRGIAGEGIDLGFHGELTVDGLVVMGARIYDPSTRCFLSRDPLPPVLALTGACNPYNFANSDPINRLDPTGLRPTSMEEFDEWRTKMTTSRAESFWNAIKEDPWGSIALALVIVAGGVLIATGFGSVGGAVLIGVAVSMAVGFANKSFSPRRSAVDGVVSGVAAFAGGAAGAQIASSIIKNAVAGAVSGGLSGLGSGLTDQKMNPDGSWNDQQIDGVELLKQTAVGTVAGGVGGGLSGKAGDVLDNAAEAGMSKLSKHAAQTGVDFAIDTGSSVGEQLVLTGEVDVGQALVDGAVSTGAGKATDAIGSKFDSPRFDADGPSTDAPADAASPRPQDRPLPDPPTDSAPTRPEDRPLPETPRTRRPYAPRIDPCPSGRFPTRQRSRRTGRCPTPDKKTGHSPTHQPSKRTGRCPTHQPSKKTGHSPIPGKRTGHCPTHQPSKKTGHCQTPDKRTGHSPTPDKKTGRCRRHRPTPVAPRTDRSPKRQRAPRTAPLPETPTRPEDRPLPEPPETKDDNKSKKGEWAFNAEKPDLFNDDDDGGGDEEPGSGSTPPTSDRV